MIKVFCGMKLKLSDIINFRQFKGASGQRGYGDCLVAGQIVSKNDIEAARYYKFSTYQGNAYG
jgi:hypothetical protein